jgi:putative DNA primase/helicase
LAIVSKYKDQLIVTTHNSNRELTGCQKIAPDGSKLFLPGQEKKGCWHWLQSPPSRGQKIVIAEGWATGASLVEEPIHMDGCAIAIAFDAGNIPTVTASLLTLYPSSRIVICRDFDKAGVNAATAAVTLDPSRVTVMEPPASAPAWATDWNDYLVFEREKDID